MISDLGVLQGTAKFALTGASGFVGGALLKYLRNAGIEPRLLSRRAIPGSDCRVVSLHDVEALTRALAGIDVVFHCAGFAHAFEQPELSQTELHSSVNHHGAVNVGRAAAVAKVKRLIFCSSVKAVGDPGSARVDETFDAPPDTAYGRAKRAAEVELAEIGEQTNLEIVILRLAMVYGPGSRGNLERMLRLVERGYFPPLPETGNHRSLVHVDDVVTAMLISAVHPAAVAKRYIVAHPDAPSGKELFDAMTLASGRKCATFAVPAALLRNLGRLGDRLESVLGRRLPLDSQSVSRLLDSAWYSPDSIQGELGWEPRIDLTTGLASLKVGQAHGN